jgi:serine/threonine protein phosphatase PrpC
MLVLLWLFVFSLAGVLRGDLYGTRVVSRITTRTPPATPVPAVSRRERRSNASGGPRNLVVTSGPLEGTRIPLGDNDILIGRNSDCLLVLDDDFASGPPRGASCAPPTAGPSRTSARRMAPSSTASASRSWSASPRATRCRSAARPSSCRSSPVPIAFRYAARSDVGLVRSENQDSGYAGPHLLVVADGMGGHAGGDIASSTVIGHLVQLDDDASGGGDSADELAAAIARANRDLQRIAAERAELTGMGTTVTALLRSRNKLLVAHIGDSRAYLWRGGQLARMTTDHSFVQTLIDQGRITPEQASTHPQRSLVTRVLTGAPRDVPDVGAREALRDDRYLLCSDGLSGFVADETIGEILATGTPDEAADKLVELALRAGAPDNVTVIVADVVDLTRGHLPSVSPQIVGAARLSPAGSRALRQTPAAKAAELSRKLGLDEEREAVERIALAEEKPSTRRGRLGKLVGAVAAVAVVIAGGAYAAYAWTQQQFFVGESQGKVTVFQGVKDDLGPLKLSTALVVSDVAVTDLPETYRVIVQNGVTATDRADADARVAELRQQAQACLAARARNTTCGSGPVSAQPSTASSTTSTTGTATSSTPPTSTSSSSTASATSTTSTTRPPRSSSTSTPTPSGTSR